MSAVYTAVNDAFQALFFGSGSWLGILLFLSIYLGLTLKWKYAGVLFLPVTIFLGLDYISHDLAWHAIIIWISSLFLMFYMVKQLK